MAIPVAGPWVAIADAGGDGGLPHDTSAKVLATTFGLTQLTGLVLLITGLGIQGSGPDGEQTALSRVGRF
jgi:hypothetical protein